MSKLKDITKKLIAIGLCFTMAFAYVSMPQNAITAMAKAGTVVNEGEEFRLITDTGSGDEYIYFTPGKSGYYLFEGSNISIDNLNPDCLLSWGNGTYQLLTAGVEYIIRAEEDGIGKITYVDTTILLDSEKKMLYDLNYSFTASEAGTYICKVSGADMIYYKDDNNIAWLTEHGLTMSKGQTLTLFSDEACTVTISKVDTNISEDTHFSAYEDVEYQFIASKAGYYLFEGSNNFSISKDNEPLMTMVYNSSNEFFIFKLEASTSYGLTYGAKAESAKVSYIDNQIVPGEIELFPYVDYEFTPEETTTYKFFVDMTDSSYVTIVSDDYSDLIDSAHNGKITLLEKDKKYVIRGYSNEEKIKFDITEYDNLLTEDKSYSMKNSVVYRFIPKKTGPYYFLANDYSFRFADSIEGLNDVASEHSSNEKINVEKDKTYYLIYDFSITDNIPMTISFFDDVIKENVAKKLIANEDYRFIPQKTAYYQFDYDITNLQYPEILIGTKADEKYSYQREELIWLEAGTTYYFGTWNDIDFKIIAHVHRRSEENAGYLGDGMHIYRCVDCGTDVEEACTYNENEYDHFSNGQHYHVCIACNSRTTPEDCTPGEPVKENERPSTCRYKGSYDEVIYCTLCNQELSRTSKELELTEHVYEEGYSSKVEEGEFIHYKTCKNCPGKFEIENCTPGNPVRENERKATCNSNGVYHEVTYCKVCGGELKREEKIIDKLEHTISNKWEADYYYHWHQCSVCDEKINDTKHTPVDKITKATLDTNGSKKTYCSVCNYQINETTIYAVGKIKLANDKVTYTGKNISTKVIVEDCNGKAIPKSEYTIDMPSNIYKAGEYTITVTFNGNNYMGSKKLTLTVKPKKPVIKSVSSKKSKIASIKWNSHKADECSGYEIQYSTNNKFKNGVKKVSVTNYKTTSKQIKKLTGGKKYYVRIRSYKKVSGKKIYSDWSKVKAVKVKK